MLRGLRAIWGLVATGCGIALAVGCAVVDDGPGAISSRPVQPANPPPADDAWPAALGGPGLFGDHPELERVPFENRLVTNLSRHSFTTEGLDFDPDVFPAEGLLVFASTRNSERPDVFLKRIDGAALTQLTSDPADDIQPRFSPDGRRIAFCSNRGGTWDIWLVGRDGTGLTQLTGDGADELAPSWSPDGRQLAYTVWGERSRQWELWTLSVEQPGARRFLACGMFPAWSPDGRRLAFQRARQRGGRLFSIWTIELVDGEARNPTEVAHAEAAACIAPRWSPDGAMITYCRLRMGDRAETEDRSMPPAAELWVVEPETGAQTKLTDGAGVDFNPVWADHRIFFVSRRSGTENIWSLTAAAEPRGGGGRPGPRVSRVDSGASSVPVED